MAMDLLCLARILRIPRAGEAAGASHWLLAVGEDVAWVRVCNDCQRARGQPAMCLDAQTAVEEPHGASIHIV
jgi:hypothetical protein